MAEKGKEKLLGVDYGETNTGLAFGRAGLASPLEVLNSKDTYTLITEINKIVAQNKLDKIVVGLPVDSDGKETRQSLKVRQFVKSLRARSRRPVELVSEYGTTKASIENAIKSGISQKRRRSNDHFSAALILKRYYAENESS